jgi:hypothetical protein
MRIRDQPTCERRSSRRLYQRSDRERRRFFMLDMFAPHQTQSPLKS